MIRLHRDLMNASRALEVSSEGLDGQTRVRKFRRTIRWSFKDYMEGTERVLA